MKSKAGIHYSLEGPEAAPVIVFSNSLGSDLRMWDKQAHFFSKDFRVLRYDTRGHGGSDLIEKSYSIADLGRDVIALMDELNIRHAHYCGLSLGGLTGIWLGIEHGHRFNSLTLADTSAKISDESTWQERIELVNREGLAPLADQNPTRWFTKHFADEHPEEVQTYVDHMLQTSVEGYIACCEVLKTTNLWSQVKDIDLPTLVMVGEIDPVTPVFESQNLAQQIRGATLAILNASHISNIEAPAFTQKLNLFLQS